ncbi:hypothetical protein LCGC14_1540430, partial [marine sediment metagenome]
MELKHDSAILDSAILDSAILDSAILDSAIPDSAIPGCPMTLDPSTLQQRWPVPSDPRPIVILGTGDIVRNAHLPAYAMAGLPVAGVLDILPQRSREVAEQFGIPRVFDSIEEAVAEKAVVFDVAVPPDHLLAIVRQLPERAVVLMQKPMGTDLASARQIAEVCREKQLVAAVNFQLRFSPVMLVAADLIRRGLIGPITDVEVHMNYYVPWELFPFLKQQKRVDMLIASIHHFDLIRSILGEPEGVYARSIPHPKYPDIEATRTSAILDYGMQTRCCLSLNNCWSFGRKHQTCTIRVEGLKGAVVANLG